MDVNNVTLVGKVGERIKHDKTVHGQEYLWFPLEVENRKAATGSTYNYHASINVMVFSQPLIRYLEKVKMKTGNTIVVLGFISSYKQEKNGRIFYMNGINADDVIVKKTRSDEDIINNNNNNNK